jgi:hypothetical protein
MSVDVAAPFRDVDVKLGNPVDDWHVVPSCGPGAGMTANMSCPPFSCKLDRFVGCKLSSL